MMKKVILLGSAMLIMFFWVGVKSVEAHLLSTDNSIGAVLHVDPNDQPIAKSQASFFFEFKDKENKFKPENCTCTFSILEGGKEVYSQPLFQNTTNPSLSNASAFYTFPQKDVYEVKVVGKPTTPNAFQEFTLTWNFRVDEEAAPQNAAPTGATGNFFTKYIAGIFTVGIILVLVIFSMLKKNNIQKNS